MTEEIRKIIDEKIEKISKYQKGDKFVVEIKESGYPYSVIGERRNCSEEFLDSLDRLDSDYINEHFGELQDEAYNQGLNDAWELAQKCVHLEGRGEDNELMFEVFGTVFLNDVFDNNSYSEALAKLKAYEEAQEIKVGDVVKCKGYAYEYLVMATSEETFSGQPFLRSTTTPYHVIYVSDADLIKTGKHIDIQSILEQIGE